MSELFTENTTSETLYLETKWASLVSFGLTAQPLKDVLPAAAPSTSAPSAATCIGSPPAMKPTSVTGNRAASKTLRRWSAGAGWARADHRRH
jgi:hypothetical protein